jgi:hypothetical protein
MDGHLHLAVSERHRNTILLAAGNRLLDEYDRAADDEKQNIWLAAVLRAQGWIWTLQGAL